MLEFLKKKDDTLEITTLIGVGTEISGDINIKGHIKIDGMVSGNIDCSGYVVIDENGSVEGNINAEAVITSGVIKGDVTVSGDFTITSTATVKGDVTARAFIGDTGAQFFGNCKIIEDGKEKDLTIPDKDDILTDL